MSDNTWYEINSVEWARSVEQRLDDYIGGLANGVDEDEDGNFDLTGEPFCGCSVCYSRATIDFLMRETAEGIATGAITFGPVKKSLFKRFMKL